MRNELVVLVPSRERPKEALELARVFQETCVLNTLLVFVVDEDDPFAQEYSKIPGLTTTWLTDESGKRTVTAHVNVCYASNADHTMVCALNGAAEFFSRDSLTSPFALGFMGDDHRPRTAGWDRDYVHALRSDGVGIVYGDDLLQGEKLPTQVAMRTSIVRALGFMAPPGLRHMYIDNFWHDLGTQARCLKYLPDVVVEHMHPIAGKAEWSEGHKRVNDRAVYQQDLAAYERFKHTGLVQAVARTTEMMARGNLGAFARQPVTRGAYPQIPVEESSDVHEWRLFEEGTVPEYTTLEWYLSRPHAPHIDQPVHRDRLHVSATFVAQLAFQGRLRTVVDLGCGDGGLLSLLGPGLKSWGYDLMPKNIEAGKARGLNVRYADVLGDCVEWGEIAVATEVIEHLVDPREFLATILDHSEALVCSSPWDERAGNAYEFHTWAWDLEGYRHMIEDVGWKVLRQRRVHRFQVVMAVRP